MYGLKNANIAGFWKRIRFICGADTDIPEQKVCGSDFDIIEVNKKIFYKCPVCGAMIPYHEIEKAVDKIAGMMIDEDDVECDVNLTNATWFAVDKTIGRKYVFRVVSHKKDNFVVEVSIRGVR